MKKIRLKFSVTPSLFPGNGMVVVMTLDENGKSYKVKKEDPMEKFNRELKKELARLGAPVDGLPEKKKELPLMPKRVLNTFTESAINKILSQDEITNESDFVVLDGNHYEITITKGNIRKKYDTNDVSIERYPLLRYLASWCRRR